MDSFTQNMKLLWTSEGEINLNKVFAAGLCHIRPRFSPHSWVKHTFSSLALQLGKRRLREVICPKSHTGEKGSQELNISLLNCKASALSPLHVLPVRSLPSKRRDIYNLSETSDHLLQYPHLTDTHAWRPRATGLVQSHVDIGDRVSVGT